MPHPSVAPKDRRSFGPRISISLTATLTLLLTTAIIHPALSGGSSAAVSPAQSGTPYTLDFGVGNLVLHRFGVGFFNSEETCRNPPTIDQYFSRQHGLTGTFYRATSNFPLLRNGNQWVPAAASVTVFGVPSPVTVRLTSVGLLSVQYSYVQTHSTGFLTFSYREAIDLNTGQYALVERTDYSPDPRGCVPAYDARITTGVLPQLSTVDLSVTKVEPVQVVYDSASPVKLVKGKATAVRVTITVNNASALLSVSPTDPVELEVEFEGKKYSDSIQKQQFAQNTTQTVVVNPKFAPASPGVKEVTVRVDPTGKITESNENNNHKSSTVVVHETKPLRVLYIPIDRCLSPSPCYGAPLNFGGIVGGTVGASNIFTQATYPVADGGVLGAAHPTPFGGDPTINTGVDRDVTDMGVAAAVYGYEKAVGIVSTSYLSWHGIPTGATAYGQTFLNGSGAIVEEGGDGSTAAHEIGHMFGISEEEYNTQPPGKPASGYFVHSSQPQVGKTCFMGNSPPGLSWVDVEHYNYLFSQFAFPVSTAGLNNSLYRNRPFTFRRVTAQTEGGGEPQLLVVGALVGKNNSVEMRPSFVTSLGEKTESAEDGNYSVRALDATGQTLSETDVKVEFVKFVEPGQRILTDTAPLIVKIPYPSNAATVELLHDGMPIAVFSPQSKLLRDAVNAIPDSGFVRNPEQTRKALLNKVEAIEKQIDGKARMGARQKLINDLRPSLVMWLKDGYATESLLQLDKEAVLKVVDDTARRLATLARGGGDIAQLRK